MGLNYNYLLYFKRDYLWEALQGIAKIVKMDDYPHTTIHFPDHDLILPIMSGFRQEHEHQYDKVEFYFDTSLIFELDEAILDYLSNRKKNWDLNGLLDEDGVQRVAIGLIFLTVYADLSQHWAFKKPSDLVLLFSESGSIRRTFTELLVNHQGVCGVFDRENDGGEVFWWNGLHVREYVEDVHLHPDEIEDILRRGWRRGKDNGF
jgi:hypothetical protein